MANTHLSFISDEHLLFCVKNLHESYLRAKENVSKKKFYKNKIDTIKLTFDANDAVKDAIDNNAEYIKAEVLALDISFEALAENQGTIADLDEGDIRFDLSIDI